MSPKLSVLITFAAAGLIAFAMILKRPHFYGNHGSCLQALQIGITAIREYGVQKGHLPKAGMTTQELEALGIAHEATTMLEYGGSDKVNLASPQRTIVLKCTSAVTYANHDVGYYCALLSGEIVLLSSTNANLGSVCPPGIGRVMIAKPE